MSLDKPWQQIGATYKSAVSPAPDKEGNVYLADPVANVIYKSDVDGKVTTFKTNSGGAKALRVGADGRLYASQPQQKRIVVVLARQAMKRWWPKMSWPTIWP